jgi:hypothetical protein
LIRLNFAKSLKGSLKTIISILVIKTSWNVCFQCAVVVAAAAAVVVVVKQMDRK